MLLALIQPHDEVSVDEEDIFKAITP